MLATPVGEEAQALAGAVHRRADADVVELPQPQLVNRKPPAPDETGDLVERVERRGRPDADAKDSDAVAERRPHEADRAWGRRRVGHVAITHPPTGSGFVVPPLGGMPPPA